MMAAAAIGIGLIGCEPPKRWRFCSKQVAVVESEFGFQGACYCWWEYSAGSPYETPLEPYEERGLWGTVGI